MLQISLRTCVFSSLAEQIPMASRDSFDDDYEDDYARGQAKPGMSTGTKILLVLLIGGGLVVVACCGSVFWFGRQAMKSFKMTQNADEVVAMSKEIADIEIPEDYQPKQGMAFNLGIDMKMAIFARDVAPQQGGGLILMQMNGPGMQNQQQMEQQFENSMEQQGQNKNITIEESETRTFTIDGQEVEFEFIKGKDPDSGKGMRQVMGMFTGRGGMAFLMLFETEESWDEEKVVQMIESITAK